MLSLVYSIFAAQQQAEAAEAAYQESLLTGFRITEVDKKLQETEAKNASTARQLELRQLVDANVAALNATGRELSGLSVNKILTRDKDVIGDDIKSIARTSLLRQLQSQSSAFAEMRLGRNRRTAGRVQAIGTLVSGIENAAKTAAPKGGTN